MEETLCGTVSAVLYQNPGNGYTVLRFRLEDGDAITVVGIIPLARHGEKLAITGRWEYHTTHGEQFRAEYLERRMPDTAEEIEQYLASKAIKGIGAKSAARIVARFGAETFTVMEQEPERLAEIPGISLKKAQEIGERFRQQFGMRRLLEFLVTHHLSAELAMPLYRAYGDLAMEALRDDPYLLTEEMFGAPFGTVDDFALSLGIDPQDSRRLEAAAVSQMRQSLSSGHTFLTRSNLLERTGNLLSLSPEALPSALTSLAETGRLVNDTIRGEPVCYLPEYHQAETYVAEWLKSRSQALPRQSDMTDIFLQQASSITYTQDQKTAISMAAQHSVFLLTGGPGTGKTTTVNGILALFDRMGLKTELAAPTGRAAQRMGDLCGREASTIHRLLECQFDPEAGDLIFVHDEDDPLKADAVIVDEVSMVDILLMEALLRALRPGCRLILVGDPDQLPSVGPGELLSDLLDSGTVPTVRLTEIFRQAQESLIILNAHRINQGISPELTSTDKDFFMMARRSDRDLVETIADLCARRLPQNLGIPADQIQVLAPTRKTGAGTTALNQRLQQALNPPSPTKLEKQYGSVTFREGDRVMQIRNNYDILWESGSGAGTGIFNGDVGKILSIDPGAETMTVSFDDRLVEYPFEDLNQLELAYATTVHKSQGSEYRAVILAVCHASPLLLTRRILYTGVTRARELLILVGDPNVVLQMTANNLRSRRNTGLCQRLQEA